MEMLTETDSALLGKTVLFAGMDPIEIKEALQFFEAEPDSFQKGEILHRMGNRMTRFGLVLSGCVQVFMDDLDGNPVIMATVSAGRTFGESLCYRGVEDEPVSVQAVSDGSVLWLKLNRLKKELESDPGSRSLFDTGWKGGYISRFLNVLSERTLVMNDRIQVLSQKTLRRKLVVFFSQCVHQNGSRSFELPFDRSAMAVYLGTNRSALSRELSAMQKEGFLEFQKSHVRILR